MSSWW